MFSIKGLAFLILVVMSVMLGYTQGFVRRSQHWRGFSLFTSSSSSSASTETPTETEKFMGHVAARVRSVSSSIVSDLRSKGYSVQDKFLSSPTCEALRQEAVALFESNAFVTSQSTRWCPRENKQIYYDKHNVYSTQLEGGDSYYTAPRLHEYIVSCVRALVPELQAGFPDARLSPTMASNKLAVCVGAGSAYDKHFDNSGLDDCRKVTVLYYLNPKWGPQLGGQFRIYNPPSENDSSDTQSTTDVEPVGDRLLVFWSDRLVHSVQPSFAPNGKSDHRYALTLWLTSDTPDAIVRDDAEIARHFGHLAK